MSSLAIRFRGFIFNPVHQFARRIYETVHSHEVLGGRGTPHLGLSLFPVVSR